MLLLSGAGLLAHGITALAMPLLTRLYSPAEFGLLSVLTSTLGIFGVAACLRYELAIPLPSDQKSADALLALSLSICTVLSLLAGVLIYCMPNTVISILRQPAMAPYIWMIPLGLWASGCYSALQAWHARKSDFGILARTRVAQSAASSGMQVLWGWFNAGPVGLLAGPLWNSGIACLALRRTLFSVWATASWTEIHRLATQYRKFPLYSTGEALANSAALYLPLILIAAHVGATEAGFLAMAMFVAQAPMSLIGSSISQVFLSRAAVEYHNSRLSDFIVEVLSSLIKTGMGPLLALGIIAPQFCELLFGDEWKRTGILVSWMTPCFLLQFLAVPISTTLHICGRQKIALTIQLAGLSLRLGLVWALSLQESNWLSEAYAVSGFVFYSLYLVAILKAGSVPIGQLINSLSCHKNIIFLWTGGAILAASGNYLMKSWGGIF